MDFHDELNEIRRRAGLEEAVRPHLTDNYNILWQGDEHMLIVADSRTWKFFALVDHQGNQVGFLDLEDIQYNVEGESGWEDDWLSLERSWVDEGLRGSGLGLMMYQKALEGMPPYYAGLISFFENRRNRQQVPKIWSRLGARQTPDGKAVFVRNPNT